MSGKSTFIMNGERRREIKISSTSGRIMAYILRQKHNLMDRRQFNVLDCTNQTEQEKTCNMGSFDLDTSTIPSASTNNENNSYEEKGYSSKGITKIEKGLFEIYIDPKDAQKSPYSNPEEYSDGTLDSD